MLEEARARLVDVETGEAPRALRALDEEPPAEAPRRRAPRRTSAEAPPRPVPPTEPEPRQRRKDGGAGPAIAGPVPSTEAAGTDDLLWLDDSCLDPFSELDVSTGSAPWKRGLRG
jgi:hypothetical protein